MEDHVLERIARMEEKLDAIRLNIGHLEAMYESEERQRRDMRKDQVELFLQVDRLKNKLSLLTWAVIVMLPMALAGLYKTMEFINKHIDK